MRTLIGTVLAALAVAPSAQGRDLITIETPSRFVDPSETVFNGPAPAVLKANVLLPEGYDGRRRFPVLYLLHGVGDTYETWSKPPNGDVRTTAAGLDAIVVMPEAGRGFYTDWFNGGRRGAPAWESHYLDALVPQVEARFAVLPGRGNRAIAGLSMGGFGATYLGAQRPDLFGAVATFSGFVQHQRPQVEAGLRLVAGLEYTDVFGPMDGAYATGHNPTRLAANLRHTRVFQTVGDGAADPAAGSSPNAVTAGGAVEAELRQQNDELHAALREAGVRVDYRPRRGVHDWPYWRAGLRDAIAWGLFGDTVAEEAPATWTFSTVRTRGRAWDVVYAFATPPETVATFRRRSGGLSVGGVTGAVTLSGAASGCTVTVQAPAERVELPDRCGRLEVRGVPRTLRRGRAGTLRLRIVAVLRDGARRPAAGARVAFGGVRAVADPRGRVRLRVRPDGRPGTRLVRVSAAHRPPARVRLRVVERR